jgi:hypothetical protein
MTILNGNGPIGEAAGTPIPDFQEFNMFSKRCGILIDGIYTEPQTGQDKITFECSCLNKGNQDIVWGFVLLEHRTTPPTPKPIRISTSSPEACDTPRQSRYAASNCLLGR